MTVSVTSGTTIVIQTYAYNRYIYKPMPIFSSARDHILLPKNDTSEPRLSMGHRSKFLEGLALSALATALNCFRIVVVCQSLGV